MMCFQSQGSWKYLVKNVKYFCSFGNSKRPVKVWLVLKSVSLPKVQQRVFCWRHHNTKLIRRHAPGISVDLKGEGLGDFRVALSQPLKAISKWPQHLAKFLNFSLSSDISSYINIEKDMKCKNNVDFVDPALLDDVFCLAL